MNLKALREAKQMTQKKVAMECGIARESYTNIENGVRKPSVRIAKRLGTVLDFDWTECYDDDKLPEAAEK